MSGRQSQKPRVCSLCEGPRDVETRTVQGVELDVCRWCWKEYGPARRPIALGEYIAQVLAAEAERDAEGADYV